MSAVTPAQKKKIAEAIRDHELAFSAEVLGKDSIPEADYKRLLAAGKIRPKKALPVDAATAATTLGTITGELAAEDAEKLSGEVFWKIITEAPTTPTQLEREAAAIARSRIGQYITGLGNKLDAAVGHVLIDADDKLRRRKLSVVRREVARGIEDRTTAKEIASKIAQATKESARNWLQIAQTELHNAIEEGKAVVLTKQAPPGEDPLVYKSPRPDACPFCVLLYLMPDKKTPRIFRLSDLMANGTNVGRKANRPTQAGPRATEWKATLGAMHTWCSCSLHHLPRGMAFGANGDLVYVGVEKAIHVETLNKAYLDHTCEG